MGFRKSLVLLPSLALLAKSIHAHCPLCTVGAAAAAGGAAYMGVSTSVVGLFIGAFGVSTGWWVSNLLKKKFIPFQKIVLILVSYIATVLPILPLMPGFYPLLISFSGDYGSLLNRTYLINLFFAGSLLGGAIVCITPLLSRRIAAWRGRMLPFQGIALTLLLLVMAALALGVIS